MFSIALQICAVLAGLASAGCWLFAAKTVSREQELDRRRKKAARSGEKLSLAGVQLVDVELRYDLIATLRHQSIWNRAGAILAAVAIAIQTVSPS